MIDRPLNGIKHHLTDAILMGYSAGTLPEAFNLLVATHISMCDGCRVQMEAFDAVGGALLDQSDISEAAMRPDSFAASMALIDARMNVGIDAETDAPIELPPLRDNVLPTPLADYVGTRLEAIKWRPIGMGVKHAVLKTSDVATARLLFIPAGVAMPDHGHHGCEITLVLKGAFEDENGYFARGDVEIADSDLHHTPVADIHEDCICLAVTDAPLKLKGLLPRIVQKFIGI